MILTVVQIALLIFMVLFFLSGMGCKDHRAWMFMIMGSVIALMLFGSIFIGGRI